MAGKPLTADEIRNRVVEVRKVRFGDVAANPRNSRRHPDNQREAFRGAVREIGFASVPVAYHSERANGALVWADGHLRGSEAASYEGDVAILDITDAEADMLLVTADPIAHLAQTDAAALEALLRDVQTSDIALQKMLADMAEEAGIGKKADGQDTEPQIDKAEELRIKWGAELGSLWACGDHRIVCGDCTDKATVERVMGGERAAAVVTDPPYGQNQAGVTNDEPEKLEAIISGCVKNLPCENAVIVAFSSPRTFPVWLDAIRDNGGTFERMLWMYKAAQETFPWRGWLLKSEAIIVSSVGKGHWQDVHPYSHDCYYKSEVSGQLDESLGWHGSVKPLDVVSDLMTRVSAKNHIVYEPFLGSGTTLIACENLSRRCRAIEISPGYVAVALERWHQHTARQPERME